MSGFLQIFQCPQGDCYVSLPGTVRERSGRVFVKVARVDLARGEAVEILDLTDCELRDYYFEFDHARLTDLQARNLGLFVLARSS